MSLTQGYPKASHYLSLSSLFYKIRVHHVRSTCNIVFLYLSTLEVWHKARVLCDVNSSNVFSCLFGLSIVRMYFFPPSRQRGKFSQFGITSNFMLTWKCFLEFFSIFEYLKRIFRIFVLRQPPGWLTARVLIWIRPPIFASHRFVKHKQSVKIKIKIKKKKNIYFSFLIK